MFKRCKVKSWLQVLQRQGCSHYYSTMHLWWHCAGSHKCSNAFCRDLYRLSQKWWFVLFMTHGQETAKFVSGSPKGFHNLQFWDMPFKTKRADVALTWSITTEWRCKELPWHNLFSLFRQCLHSLKLYGKRSTYFLPILNMHNSCLPQVRSLDISMRSAQSYRLLPGFEWRTLSWEMLKALKFNMA